MQTTDIASPFRQLEDDQRPAALGWVLKRFDVEASPDEFEAVAELFLQGDELADALAARYADVGVGQAHAALTRALEEGIDAVPDACPEMVALFAQLDSVPDWVDWELMDIGARALRRAGPLTLLFFRDIFLVASGYPPGGNRPMVLTGALERGASRRVFETNQWGLDVLSVGGMRRDGAGFKTTAQVRMLHALLRRRLSLREDWPTETCGLPISQGHLLLTNLLLSAGLAYGLSAFGMLFSPRERQGITHLWRYNGYVMGVREEFLAVGPREMVRQASIILNSNFYVQQPDDDSRRMTRGLVDEVYERWSGPGIERAIAAAERRLHGGVMAWIFDNPALRLARLPTVSDDLELPHGRWIGVGPALAATFLSFELAGLAVPGGRKLSTRVSWGLTNRLHQHSKHRLQRKDHIPPSAYVDPTGAAGVQARDAA